MHKAFRRRCHSRPGFHSQMRNNWQSASANCQPPRPAPSRPTTPRYLHLPRPYLEAELFGQLTNIHVVTPGAVLHHQLEPLGVAHRFCVRRVVLHR